MATRTLKTIKKAKRRPSVEEVEFKQPKTMSGVTFIILDVCNPRFMHQAKKFNYKFIKMIKQDAYMRYESELQPVLLKNKSCKALRKIWSRDIAFQKKQTASNLIQRLKFASLTSLQINSVRFPEETTLEGNSLKLNHFQQLAHLTLKFDANSSFNKAGLLSLSKNLQCLSSLKSLALSFYFRDEQTTDDQALDIICNGFKRLKSLSKFFLFLGDKCEISDEGVKRLSSIIQGLPSLSDLTLTFPRKSITGLGMENLLEGFVSLQTVKLNFYCINNIKNFTISGLQKAFKKLSSLKTLDLNFQSSALEDQGLERIFEAIQYLPSLLELYLDFSYCSGMKNFKIPEDSYLLTEGLQQILKLRIDLRLSHVQYYGLNSLFKWINNLKSLTVLEIQMDRYKIVDESDVSKMEKFQQLELNSLTTLKFMFQDSDEEYYKMLQKLFFSLGGLKNLQILDMDLADCKCFEAKAGEGLGDLLGKLTKLTELRLNLRRLTNINSKACRGISRAFQNLKCLSSLEIILEEAEYSGLNELKDHLRFLSNLKKLHLNLARCKVSQKSAEALCESLASLTSLSSLHLNFDSNKLSDNLFKKLAQSLKSLNNPTNYELCLSLAQSSHANPKDGITKKGFTFLMQGLCSIPNLSKLDINFCSNKNINNQTCLQSFGNIFKNMLSLTKLRLDFDNFRDIEKHDLLSFIDPILQVKTLTYLELELTNCNIDETSMDYLSSKVRRIGSGSYIRF